VEHIIPSSWFAGLSQWVLLLITAIAVGILIKGADWLVDGASGLAYRLGISEVIVGATVVSLGTTSPECGVSVMAAWTGEPGLALGNAIGSIIADTGLIFGLGCLLAVIPADRYVLVRQGWVQFGAAVLLAVLCYGAYVVAGERALLGRWVGLLLLALLVGYMALSVRWSRAHPGPAGPGGDNERRHAHEGSVPMPRLLGLILLGLIFVLLASRTLVLSVSELAENHWHVPKVVIAATLVALGTSLPEMVVGLTSIAKGHRELLVGNVIGADILNVLFVVGASAAAAPLPILDESSSIPEIALLVHIPTMLVVLLYFRLIIHWACRAGHFRRWQGVPLVLMYVIYVVLQYAVV
jgi:cation:H+ antiporter